MSLIFMANFPSLIPFPNFPDEGRCLVDLNVGVVF